MSKKLLVLAHKNYDDSSSLYDVKVTKSIVRLDYSKLQETWTAPGKPAYTLVDNGWGYEFVDHTLNKTITLDYCQAQVLRAILKLDDRENTAIFKLFKESK
jgi:hypothetical protein